MSANVIDRYLDRLLLELRGRAHDVRRILAEAEEHLRDATAEGVADGLTEEEAQRRAVDRFGAPRVVARRFDRGGVLRGDLVWALTAALVPFTVVGLIAIGVSGVVAELLGRIFSPELVAGDLPWMRYTAARCADFQEYFPGKGCMQAAALHHWGEVVEYRVAAGVLGLVVLAGYLFYRRRSDRSVLALPSGLTAAVGVALYGLATGALLLEGLSSAMAGWDAGSGQWLSAGGVALVVALAYGRLFLREAIPPRPATS